MNFSVKSQWLTGNSCVSGGFSLVEIVIGSALILLSVVGLVTSYSLYVRAGLSNTDAQKASYLLEEGVEAVTLLRDDAWSNLSALSTSTPYYLSWNGTTWVATTTLSLIDGTFTRSFRVGDVYRRDSDKDIVATTSPDAKSVDIGTRKLTVTVRWGTASTTATRQVTTYLANLFE